jgi:DNA-binding transcriptional LysR family regulator
MQNLDNLEPLRCFSELYRERHLSRAALRAGLSQPAMSRALARLRATFDDPLFVRSSRGMDPTPRADELAPRIRDLLAAAANLLEPQRFDPSRLVRTFVIATPGFAESQFLPPLVATLAKEAPGVSITLRPTSLDFEGIDLVVGRRDAMPAEARHVRLYVETYSCAVRQKHPCKRLTLARYVQLPHLVVAPGNLTGNIVDSALAAQGLTRRVVVRVHTFPLAPAIISGSDLILTGPTRSLEVVAKPYCLRLLLPPIALAHQGVFAGWHPRFHADPAHAWFRAMLLAATRSGA